MSEQEIYKPIEMHGASANRAPKQAQQKLPGVNVCNCVDVKQKNEPVCLANLSGMDESEKCHNLTCSHRLCYTFNLRTKIKDHASL